MTGRVCQDCGVPIAGKYARYCQQHRSVRRKRHSKWAATPEIDALIRAEYGGPHYGVKAARVVALRTGWPVYAVRNRAVVIGATRFRKREKNWTKAEVDVLARFAWMHPSGIKRKLHEIAGTDRTVNAITIKRKRYHLGVGTNGYSATALSVLLGVDNTTVAKWCRQRWLAGLRRESDALSEMGRDGWWISEEALRRFLIERSELIDVSKVTDSQWFISVLAGAEALDWRQGRMSA